MGNDTLTPPRPDASESHHHLMTTQEIWEPLHDARRIPLVLAKLLETYPPTAEVPVKVSESVGYRPLRLNTSVLNLLGFDSDVIRDGLMITPEMDAPAVDIWTPWYPDEQWRQQRLAPLSAQFVHSRPFSQPERVVKIDYYMNYGVGLYLHPVSSLVGRIFIPDVETLRSIRFAAVPAEKIT